MKKIKKLLALTGLFVLGAFFASAQSTNPNWIISKDVQRFANKDKFANEQHAKSYLQVQSVDVPSIVMSKGVFRKPVIETKGNIESKGYPSWIISKGVNRYNKK